LPEYLEKYKRGFLTPVKVQFSRKRNMPGQKGKVLIVEDDKNIAKLVSYNLQKAEFAVSIASSGEEALALLEKETHDLILLDVMLPQMDGFELCRVIKQNARLRGIPVVMLTAKGEEIDRVVGFELGVDDYIVKPFSPRELVLRIKAIMRRGKQKDTAGDLLNIGNITVDIPRHKVTVNGREVELTAMEFKLLVTLIERRGRVQTRERLLSDVWGIDADIDTRTIDTHIKRLRQKLEGAYDSIETIRGVGYRLKEEDEN
jgi:DNA-binding response OmpR family regulator